MTRTERTVVIALAIWLLCGRTTFALNPSLDLSQYAHTSWKIREGFLPGAILSMAQTPGGYLWLGTTFGLVRFDGVRAVPWQPDSEQIPSNWLRAALLVARDGTLWIGTDKGLASWKYGKVTEYPEFTGQGVTSLLQDTGGTLWFGVENPGRLCAVRVAKIQCYGAGSFGGSVRALYEDHKGNLWASAQTGLWRWAPGPPEPYRLPFPMDGVVAGVLIEDDSGALVTGSLEGLKQLTGGIFRDYALPGIDGEFRTTRLFQSRDGSLWFGTTHGLLHQHQGKIDRLSVTDGLSGEVVLDIFEDREGNIWVSTNDGLDRFRDVAIPTISSEQGLSNSTSFFVQSTPDGSIWIGTLDGLNRWQDGHVTVYGGRKSSGRTSRTEFTATRKVTEIANSGLDSPVRTMTLQDRGQPWVAAPNGVFYFEGGRFSRVLGLPGGNIFSIAADGKGGIWVSNNDEGLFYSTKRGVVRRIPWSQFRKKRGALALLPDQLGGLWLGFLDGGIAYWRDGQVSASYFSLGDHRRYGVCGCRVSVATEPAWLERADRVRGSPLPDSQRTN